MLGETRGRKHSCPSGGNEKKERRKRSRWVCTDKIETTTGGSTQGQFFVGVQKVLRKLNL